MLLGKKCQNLSRRGNTHKVESGRQPAGQGNQDKSSEKILGCLRLDNMHCLKECLAGSQVGRNKMR